MIRVKLGAEDRERLGAPEVMEYDPARVRVADVRALKRATGMDVEQLADALKSKDLEAMVALVWLCLHRAGVKTDFEELDFDITELVLEVDEQGKATSSTGS